MNQDDPELDSSLRRKLAELYGEPSLALGRDAEQRVVAAALRESERLVRARRWKRVVGWSAGTLAAAAALMLWIAPFAHAPSTAPNGVLACGLPAGQDAPRFTRASDGRQALSLGPFGELFADSAAEVQIEHATACELSIRLAAGTLAGDLHSLRPATLRVRTALGEVVVRGTRFSVRADDGLEVVLLSGTVEVIATDQAPLRLTPGHFLRKAAAAKSVITKLSPEHAQKLRELLEPQHGVSPVPQAAAANAPATDSAKDGGGASTRWSRSVSKPTADLLAAAEAERRRGRISEARALYREAGSRADENAEVALLRWSRLELESGDPAAARSVLGRYQKGFPAGRLETEALWLKVRVLQAQGEREQARSTAQELLQRFPTTPQAKAARRILDAR
jgi:tetratricopeptide (TPR) repeat protein